MDRATRAFILLAFSASVAYIVLGFWGCTALVGTLSALTADGFDLTPAGHDLRPALVVVVLELTVSIVGIASLNRQLVATERLVTWVRGHVPPVPGDLPDVVGQWRSRARLDVVDVPGLVSFTYGFLRPRIVLSRELVEVSSPDELAAVLEHELYHARSFDPLKMAVARALPAAFFFLPLLRDLRDRYALGRELAADRRAAARCGVAPLAHALARATGGPPAFEPAAGAALGGGQLRARIEQLETGTEPEPDAIPRLRSAVTAASLAGVAYLVVVARSSVAAVGTHGHAPPMGNGTGVASVVATGLCFAFWAWVTWRLARWLVARRPGRLLS